MDITGIGSLLQFGTAILDRIFPDPAQRDAAKLELLKLQQQGEFKEMDQQFALMNAQIDVNKVEASNPSLFVSGWRPATGWLCAIALGYVGIIDPMARFCATVFYHYTGSFPVVDTTLTTQILLGMMGLGSLRTFEKVQGVAAK